MKLCVQIFENKYKEKNIYSNKRKNQVNHVFLFLPTNTNTNVVFSPDRQLLKSV